MVELPVSKLVTELYHSILPAIPNADQVGCLDTHWSNAIPEKRVGDAPDQFE